MTHLKTTKARKSFVRNRLRTATPSQIASIYRATEKAVKFRRKT